MVDLNEVAEVACNIAFNELRHRAKLVKDFKRIPLIAADRAKLVQVVLNLLVNAAHAIQDGSSDQNRIEVQTYREGEVVVVAVEDTGCGIPEYQLGRILDPFFTTKPQGLGTGLGLSISIETVRKHGGDIRVQSTVGRGSRFEVVLPEESGLRTTVHDVAEVAGERAPRVRARVLLIDDEPMLRRAIRRILEPTHEVVETGSGAEGLEAIAHDGDFDVIIS